MTRDLSTDEGVAEGSAASSQESAVESDGAERDVVGLPPHGEAEDESDPAPPAGRSGAESEGQTLELGEG